MLDCGGRADRGYARGDCRAAEIIAIVKRMMTEAEAVACETSRAVDRSRSTCRPLHRRNAQPGRPHDADHRQGSRRRALAASKKYDPNANPATAGQIRQARPSGSRFNSPRGCPNEKAI